MAPTTARSLLHRFHTAASKSSRLFSSSTAAASYVYERALKLQRPTTVRYQENLHNSVNLIGAVEFPFKECKTVKHGKFGVCTSLRVMTGGHRYFSVFLKFWNDIANVSVQHLKPHDLIYVSGHLESYMKLEKNGKHMYRYEVNVSEVNFVAQHGAGTSFPNSVKLEPIVSIEDIKQRYRDRLHLWQIFFANPYEWWDSRKRKLSPSTPDFKHKDTGEKLWLKDSDPPWIKKQLQLHDSRLSRPYPGEHRTGRLSLSPFVYDDDAERT